MRRIPLHGVSRRQLDLTAPMVVELSTDLTPERAVVALRSFPDTVFLDSSDSHDDHGRYSYVTADPFLVMRAQGRRIESTTPEGRWEAEGDPLFELQGMLRIYHFAAVKGLPPFQGGAAGYFGYDLGRQVERIPVRAVDDLGLPELHIGIYDWVLAWDHRLRKTWLVATGMPSRSAEAAGARIARVRGLLEASPAATTPPLPSGVRLRSNFRHREYLAAVRRAQEYIAAGDIYQVNLSQRLTGAWTGDPWTLYRTLRSCSPVPYGAYLDFDDVKVLSASPESFLRFDGRMVQTQPMKGTRPRGRTPDDDERLAAELAASAKDRAENVMIVDLLRNDLGKVCRVGSVHVPRLFAIEGYSHVWQMVSTVEASLSPGLDAVDLLRACFPGGSVTGCPKIRAMEIIEELEPVRRGIYCGAIGYLGFGGAMALNIVIRTLVLKDGELYLQVGGAVVADSDPEGEYAETLAKAAAALAALGADIEET